MSWSDEVYERNRAIVVSALQRSWPWVHLNILTRILKKYVSFPKIVSKQHKPWHAAALRTNASFSKPVLYAISTYTVRGWRLIEDPTDSLFLRIKKAQDVIPTTMATIQPLVAMPATQPILAMPGANSTEDSLKAWVFHQYCEHGFNRSGFKGYTKLKGHLSNQVAVKQVRKRVIEVMER